MVESSAALGTLVRKTGHVSVMFQPPDKGSGDCLYQVLGFACLWVFTYLNIQKIQNGS